MSVFDTMLGTLFRDPNMGSDATYTPAGGGTPVPCRLVWITQADIGVNLGDLGATAASRVAEIRVSDITAVAKTGRVTVGGQTYRVNKATNPDADRLLWRVELA